MDQIKWFIQGLPKAMAAETVQLANLDLAEPDTLDFDKTYEVTMKLVHFADVVEAFRNSHTVT